MTTLQLKQARLNSIRDEVKQLHPLLKLLLPKLPRVQHVEETHGTNEMGSDFVFSRSEEIFRDLEYVGVIAKVGKVVQDYTAIERQIKECEIERFFGNGRRKIFLSEIWVVATGQISNGAQQKIHAEYRTRKIVFVDGDRLSALIDQHLPNYWTDVSLEIGDYLHTVWTANDRTDKALSLIGSHEERFYIDQDVFEAEQYDRKRPKPPRRVDIDDLLSCQSVVLVEGGMGSGKSKLLRHLVDAYATPQQFLKTGLIPVAATFKDFVDKFDGDPQKAVDKIVPEAVRVNVPKDVKYLLLLDGADEKNLGADELANTVGNVAKAINANGMKAVITSRWCEAFEGNSSIRSLTKRVELRPLSTNRLIEFIRRLCRGLDAKSRLIEDLKRSELFKELPKSPIAAILLAQLLNENAKELPSNLTELYSKYVELSLGRWDVDRGLQTQKEFEALTTIVTQLAEYFLANQIEEMPVDAAKDFFANYLKKRNLGLGADALFHTLISRCDIVAIDPVSGVFRFKHKTFIEFFYAKAHFKKPMQVDHRVWSPYWISAFYFYVGLQKDCPELLEEIFKIEPRDEGERWMRLVNIPNYLLAGFSSPYDVTEKAVAMAMQEAAELYEDVSQGKIKSPLAFFPKMHFLWLVQMVIRKNYDYEFFRKAIALAAVQIDATCMDRKRCATALFFLSAIGRELGEKSCFDFLISNYQKDLTTEIELAIHHETDDDKHRSHLVKKLDQRVGRALKANPSFRTFVTSLYEKPIRTWTASQKSL